MADEPKDGQDDVNPLQEKLDAEIKNAIKQRERAQTAEASLADVTTRLQALEASNTKAAEDVANQKKLDKGQYQELLDAQKASQQKLFDAEKARGDGAEAALRNILGRDSLKTELATAGVKAEFLGQAATLLAGQIDVSFADGKHSVTVRDAEGNPSFTGGEATTLAQLAASFAETNAHFRAPTGDTGSGNHQGTPDNKGVTQATLLADPKKHNEWVNSFPPGESTEAWAKLPRK